MITTTPVSLESSKHSTRRVLTLALTGTYVAGGDTLNLTAAGGPNSKGIDGFYDFSNSPDYAGNVNIPGLYKAEVIIGATPATCKLKIYDLTTATQGELTNGAAYPAGLLATTPPTSPVTVEIGHAKSNR
jgi:hypothetical protein